MTPEEAAKKFCSDHSNPNWARHHEPALGELIREFCRAALRERDAAWAKAIRTYYGGDVPCEGATDEAAPLRALLEEAGSNG